MDKRAAKILISCISCTLIVILLFMIAFHFSKLSCDLVHIEPLQLRNAQLAAFDKDKPIRSEDKTILMKFSAYLEYDLQKSDGDDDEDDSSKDSKASPDQPSSARRAAHGNSPSNGSSQSNATADDWPVFFRAKSAPDPSNPTSLFNGSAVADADRNQAKKRFLPLELDSIETRHISDAPNKYKYILSFNCTKMHLILVRQPGEVFIESIRLELKKSNKRKSECDVQLPSSAFAVGHSIGQRNNDSKESSPSKSSESRKLLRYYCNKPLSFKCYHNGSNNNHVNKPTGHQSQQQQQQNGIYLADLHISALEYETSSASSPINGEQKLKLVSKNEFKANRGEYSGNHSK